MSDDKKKKADKDTLIMNKDTLIELLKEPVVQEEIRKICNDEIMKYMKQHNESQNKNPDIDAKDTILEFNEKNKKLQAKVKKLGDEVNGLKDEKEKLYSEISQKDRENERLRKENTDKQNALDTEKQKYLEKEKELESKKNKIKEIKGELEATGKELENLKEQFGDIIECFQIYKNLPEGIRVGLENVIRDGTEISFVISCASEENLGALWDYAKHIISNPDNGNKIQSIEELKKIFEFSFKIYNIYNPKFEMDDVKIGDRFDDQYYARARDSKTSGKIEKIVLRGYRIKETNKIIRKSLVMVR